MDGKAAGEKGKQYASPVLVWRVAGNTFLAQMVLVLVGLRVPQGRLKTWPMACVSAVFLHVLNRQIFP